MLYIQFVFWENIWIMTQCRQKEHVFPPSLYASLFIYILWFYCMCGGKWCTLLLHWPLEKKLTLFMLSRPLVRGRSLLTNRGSWKRWESFRGVHIVTLTTKISQKNFIAPNPVQVETNCPFRTHTVNRSHCVCDSKIYKVLCQNCPPSSSCRLHTNSTLCATNQLRWVHSLSQSLHLLSALDLFQKA